MKIFRRREKVRGGGLFGHLDGDTIPDDNTSGFHRECYQWYTHPKA